MELKLRIQILCLGKWLVLGEGQQGHAGKAAPLAGAVGWWVLDLLVLGTGFMGRCWNHPGQAGLSSCGLAQDLSRNVGE